ncbi:unnamed protein product, partial [Meganyctiphanes norvegica]
MALYTRSRRIPRSEFTRDYYRQSPSLGMPTPNPVSAQYPQAPAVPSRVPGDLGDVWSPAVDVNPAVWRASHSAKMHDAKHHQSIAQRTVLENTRVCEEVRKLTEDHRSLVERRLDDRLCDISFWREEVDKRHATINKDTEDLKTLKERLTKALYLYLRPLEVAQECINIRLGRIGVEEVEDEASTALRQEVEEIISCREALARSLSNSEQQIRRDLSCRYHLAKHLRDKDEAIHVDQATRHLTPTAPPTAIIPGQEINPSPVTVEWWLQNGMNLLNRADKEHHLSVQISTVSDDVLVASSRHLRERLEHTNHALQARISDTRRAKTLVEQQHAALEDNMLKLETSLAEVLAELHAKEGPLALAQTRLRTRRQRPNMECTSDEVEAALLLEVQELERTISRLTKSVRLSQEQLHQMRATKVSLEHDINIKANTILLDEVQVMGLRNTVQIDTY